MDGNLVRVETECVERHVLTPDLLLEPLLEPGGLLSKPGSALRLIEDFEHFRHPQPCIEHVPL